MWKPEHRRTSACKGLRYPNDLSDLEWALIEPLIPPAKRGGRRREIDVREVLNAIFYVLSTGCQVQALPKDLPPKSTAHNYFMLWEWDGTLERIHHIGSNGSGYGRKADYLSRCIAARNCTLWLRGERTPAPPPPDRFPQLCRRHDCSG
jgi:transposase